MNTMTNAVPQLLLIDDDETDRMAVRRALSNAGLSAKYVECVDAHEALSHAAPSFDCVLLDYMLPQVTAFELLASLREKIGRTPIIVLTGYGDEQVAVELMKAGVSDYLSKDKLDGQLLKRAVRSAIAIRSALEKQDRAEHSQRLYDEKIGALAALGRELLGELDVEARARRSASAARELLDAEAVRLVLPDRRLPLTVTATATELSVVAKGDLPSLGDDRRYVSLGAEGALLGALYVKNSRIAAALGRVYEALMNQVGETVFVSMENARLQERTERAVQARDSIIAVVSHDLRSPLSGINLGLQLLREPATPEENAIVLDRMERSAAHMRRLIEDLLDVARIDNGEFSVRPRREAIASLVDGALQIMRPVVEAAGVGIDVSLGAAADIRIDADTERVSQLLGNLLSNALKFTPRGGRIDLTVISEPERVIFTVADHGPGIDPDHLPRVFDRFWRKEGRGLGLGLFIARAIVEAHDGEIWAQSSHGQGARFAFSLPRPTADHA